MKWSIALRLWPISANSFSRQAPMLFDVAKHGCADRYEYLDQNSTRKRQAELPARLLVCASSFFRPLERQPPDHRVIAEAGTDAVDGVLGDCRAAVDQVGGIGLIRRDQRAGAD